MIEIATQGKVRGDLMDVAQGQSQWRRSVALIAGDAVAEQTEAFVLLQPYDSLHFY